MQQHLEPPGPMLARKIVSAWQGYNRRRWAFERDVLPVDERAPFVCECTNDACLSSVELTMYEYEAAHMLPTWCAVRPGHMLDDDGGRIVIREPHFCVVELVPYHPSPRRRQVTADRSGLITPAARPSWPGHRSSSRAGHADPRT